MARIVVALGGNALQTGNANSADDQKKVARQTAKRLTDLVHAGHDLVITHGNGPQVGNILLHEEAAATNTSPAMPLETDVAMSQGQIGYWLAQGLDDELNLAGVKKDVAAVITQSVINANDPALKNPTKPVGPFYDEHQAKQLAASRGWKVIEDAGRGWRRVVPSPRPIDIIEKRVIKGIVDSGAIVIAVGGGGIPVIRRSHQLVGVDAVIDKDFAAVELAKWVEASIFISLTAVENAVVNFSTQEARPIGLISVSQMEKYVAENQFASGSMLPKVQASLDFVKYRPENVAIITTPDRAVEAVAGQAGTIIRND